MGSRGTARKRGWALVAGSAMSGGTIEAPPSLRWRLAGRIERANSPASVGREPDGASLCCCQSASPTLRFHLPFFSCSATTATTAETARASAFFGSTDIATLCSGRGRAEVQDVEAVALSVVNAVARHSTKTRLCVCHRSAMSMGRLKHPPAHAGGSPGALSARTARRASGVSPMVLRFAAASLPR